MNNFFITEKTSSFCKLPTHLCSFSKKKKKCYLKHNRHKILPNSLNTESKCDPHLLFTFLAEFQNFDCYHDNRFTELTEFICSCKLDISLLNFSICCFIPSTSFFTSWNSPIRCSTMLMSCEIKTKQATHWSQLIKKRN